MLLLLLSHFSRVQLCATPQTATHQAPPSLGFSRQEYWSGLPFPSPMRESEKWKVKVKSLSRVRLLATPWTADYQAPPSMGFSRQEYWSGVPLPSLRSKHRPILKQFLGTIQWTGNKEWNNLVFKPWLLQGANRNTWGWYAACQHWYN